MISQKVTIKPITISKSIWYFLISSILIYLGLYVFTPILLDNGIPFVFSYLVFLYSPHVLLFTTAFILYRKEGNAWNVLDFKQRMRLNPLKKSDWLWIIGIFLFYVIIMLVGQPIMNKLSQIPFFSPPDFFPAEINPTKTSIPGYMMNYRLSKKYWVIAAYFIGWFFNIFGEEFLWRGIILPRQIEQYGSKAWIYHGFLWGFWHFFWKWQLVMLIPFSLFFSYVAYKRKNTWIGIISHGALNFVPLLMIIFAVFE